MAAMFSCQSLQYTVSTPCGLSAGTLLNKTTYSDLISEMYVLKDILLGTHNDKGISFTDTYLLVCVFFSLHPPLKEKKGFHPLREMFPVSVTQVLSFSVTWSYC